MGNVGESKEMWGSCGGVRESVGDVHKGWGRWMWKNVGVVGEGWERCGRRRKMGGGVGKRCG